MVADPSSIENLKLNDHICESCIKGKRFRLPSKKSKDRTYINRPLLNIHSDICGPINPITIDNKIYFFILVDEYTHYCVTYLAEFKSELLVN